MFPVDLYGVRTLGVFPEERRAEFRIFVLEYERERRRHPPLPKDASFFVRVLWEDAGPHGVDRRAPIAEAVTRSECLDDDWIDANAWRLIESVEELETWNFPVPEEAWEAGHYLASYEERGGRWENEERLVTADFRITVADPRWIQHLTPGRSWGTTAYKTRAELWREADLEVAPDLRHPVHKGLSLDGSAGAALAKEFRFIAADRGELQTPDGRYRIRRRIVPPQRAERIELLRRENDELIQSLRLSGSLVSFATSPDGDRVALLLRHAGAGRNADELQIFGRKAAPARYSRERFEQAGAPRKSAAPAASAPSPDRSRMRARAQAAPLASEELREILELHAKWLADGGATPADPGQPLWEFRLENGLVYARYCGPQASEESGGRQATLQLRNLSGLDLRDADLRRANLCGVSGEGLCLAGANFEEAAATDAWLPGCDFSGANLRAADFSRSILSGAALRDARLEATDFEGADLRDADFTNAFIPGVRMRGARFAGMRGFGR